MMQACHDDLRFERDSALIHDSYNCGKGSKMGKMTPWPSRREGFLYVGYHHQAPASSGFLLRVEFESSSSKKFEYQVEYRVAIAVVGSVILDVIIISDIAVILSRLDWILK